MHCRVLVSFLLVALGLAVEIVPPPLQLDAKVSNDLRTVEIASTNDKKQQVGKLIFTTNNIPHFRVSTYPDGVKKNVNFGLGFFDVVEFSDLGGEGWDADDNITSVYTLTDKANAFSPLIHEPDTNNCIHHIWTQLKPGQGTLNLRFDMYVACRTSQVTIGNNSVEISPTKMHFAITLGNYPYNENATDTSLALRAVIHTAFQVIQQNGQEKGNLYLKSKEQRAYYEWNNTIQYTTKANDKKFTHIVPSYVIGQLSDRPTDKELNTLKEPNEFSVFMVFTVPVVQPSEFYWQPAVGYDLEWIETTTAETGTDSTHGTGTGKKPGESNSDTEDEHRSSASAILLFFPLAFLNFVLLN